MNHSFDLYLVCVAAMIITEHCFCRHCCC